MFEAGVRDMAIYIPPLFLSHADLADARGIPREKYLLGLGNRNMSIVPNWEDAVTMAANAAAQLLEKSGMDPEDIQQLVVSTESGVDHSKPVASFVQGLLAIGSRCRTYEIKHACYGGTAGIVSCLDWISRNHQHPKNALVIMTDIARYGFGSPGEPTQGAGAVAMLLSKDPALLSIDTAQNGIFSKDVFDFWRPTGHRVPIVDGKYSIDCYLMALDGAVTHFRQNMKIRQGELLETFDYIIYHMPFATMARKAHRRLIEIDRPDLDPEAQGELFAETYGSKVEPGLLGAREIGNVYTGSVYLGLVSLLDAEREKAAGRRVGIFSYGSGCGAEFFLCQLKDEIGKIIEGFRFREQLNRRKRITFEQYVQIYSKGGEEIRYLPGEAVSFKDPFTRFVFTGFSNHKRQYWS